MLLRRQLLAVRRVPGLVKLRRLERVGVNGGGRRHGRRAAGGDARGGGGVDPLAAKLAIHAARRRARRLAERVSQAAPRLPQHYAGVVLVVVPGDGALVGLPVGGERGPQRFVPRVEPGEARHAGGGLRRVRLFGAARRAHPLLVAQEPLLPGQDHQRAVRRHLHRLFARAPESARGGAVRRHCLRLRHSQGRGQADARERRRQRQAHRPGVGAALGRPRRRARWRAPRLHLDRRARHAVEHEEGARAVGADDAQARGRLGQAGRRRAQGARLGGHHLATLRRPLHRFLPKGSKHLHRGHRGRASAQVLVLILGAVPRVVLWPRGARVQAALVALLPQHLRLVLGRLDGQAVERRGVVPRLLTAERHRLRCRRLLVA
mmetsp:Transcript_34003/g.74627  ORF Transcript_34003/g.74627 Transcript_34003/m.74627 type:complete len:377 (+) Transcript_34003:475-1605(+)